MIYIHQSDKLALNLPSILSAMYVCGKLRFTTTVAKRGHFFFFMKRSRYISPSFLSLRCDQGCIRWGGRRGSCPLCLLPWGAGGARIALNADIFTSLLSCEGAFAGILGSFFMKTFLGAGPQTPNLSWYRY